MLEDPIRRHSVASRSTEAAEKLGLKGMAEDLSLRTICQGVHGASVSFQTPVLDHSKPGDSVRSSVERFFYMHNCLQSLPTPVEARQLVDRLWAPLASSTFELRQWVSNVQHCSILMNSGQSGQDLPGVPYGKIQSSTKRLLSIPRLELCAAVVGAQIATVTQLTLKISRITLWTDSTTVLMWVQSESCCFKVFVGTRVAEIQELTDIGFSKESCRRHHKSKDPERSHGA